MNRERLWPLALFLVLVLPLSWYGFLLRGSTPDDSGLNPLGPLVAGLVVCAVSGQFREYIKRVTRVRMPPSTYAIALGLPLVFCLVSVAAGAAVTGMALPVAEAQAQVSNFVDGFLVALLFVALGEEPGWRGYLFPTLSKWAGPAVAALLVCPIWAIWHYPLFGAELPLDFLPLFLVSLTGASFVLAWLTLRGGGGVLPAMLCHGMTNGIGSSYLFQLFEGDALAAVRWINALLWLGAGVVAAIAMQREYRGSVAQFEASPDEIPQVLA